MYHRHIFREELNSHCQLLQDHTLQEVVDRSINRVQSKILSEMIRQEEKSSIEGKKSLMDQAAEKVISKVIERIVYEMECLYHVDTIFRTAENAVSNILIKKISKELIADQILTEAKSISKPPALLLANPSHISIPPLSISATPKNFDIKKLEALKLPKEKFLKLMKDSVSPERAKKQKKLNL